MQAMLPLIYVYRTSEKLEPSINQFSTENSISPADIFRIIPEKRLLHIDQIKEIIKHVSITSVHPRLFVLYDIDLAGPPAQNSLLKTLEEKKETDFFILCVTQLELVLTTIRSRCNVIYIESGDDIQVSPEVEQFADLLLSKSLQVLSDKLVMGINLEKAVLLLDEIILSVQKRLAKDPVLAAMILKETLLTKSLLQSNNLNPQLAVDALLIKITKSS
jgi:DNA polymerase III delta prime subunit